MENCYPKWIYHKTESAKIVQSKEEHDAQGSDWQEAPFAIDQKQAQASNESQASEKEASASGEKSEKPSVKKTKKGEP